MKDKGRKLSTGQLPAVCVAAGFLLYGFLKIMAGHGAAAGEGLSLKRADHGEGEVQYEVLVKGLWEGQQKEKTVEIPVRERQYTKEEADRIYEEALPALVDQILGENSSLEEVRQDLKLTGRLEPYGISVKWASEQPEFLDSFGGVHNEEVSETGQEVYLRASLTDGIHEREYELRAVVLPPARTEEERALQGFQSWVKREDENQQTGKELKLPAVYEGRPLSCRREEEKDYRILPVLGILAAALLTAREKNEKQNAAKKREHQLLLDYSEVVSKLMVFIGAGMTVRLAWERVVKGYERTLKQGTQRFRPAYEEMAYTVRQMEGGTPESKAYTEFGRRCGLQPYLKLSALLEQNRKTGTKNLKSALEQEMASAFEQRKNMAKRMGEEAGTRLLLPLFLMLGIVMVMIVVPAFLSFY